MRNKFLSLLIPFLVVTALILAACAEEENNIITKKSCAITFNVIGAQASYEIPAPITVRRGGAMEDQYPDPDPVFATAGVDFDGWYDSGIRYDADTIINSDLNLTAKWVPANTSTNMVTVTFVSDGSTVPAMRVPTGKPIGLRIPVSRKKNYTFNGWFSGGTQYTASSPVITANVTLTAQWTIKPTHTVTFRTFDRNILDPVQAAADQCVVPSVQVYDGEGLEDALPGADVVTHTNNKIKFIRWTGPVSATDNGVPYDGFTAITEDMTFYAKWGLDPYPVDLSATTLVNGDSYNMSGDTGPVRIATPVYNQPELVTVTGGGANSIINSVMYDGQKNRWLILYRIGLNLPADFNMKYYARYTVRAKFYGNNRAIKTDPLYSSGYMNDADAITRVGQEMPPKAGYGQISWCVTDNSNGNPGQDKPGVIAQQYNLGTTTINNQWLVGGSYEGSEADAIRPNYLLIQTSDNWIGWIEITEIIFHNGEEEFVPPPAAGE